MEDSHRSRPLLLGHRGCRGAAPENTVAAFDLCMKSGCDGFEFDVRQTSDSTLILWHDPKFLKLSVSASTYEQLLKQNVNSEVCVLAEVLERFGRTAWLDIELKITGMERAVAEALRRNQPREYVVSSFLPEVLVRMHEEDGSVPLGLIFDDAGGLRRWQSLPIGYLMPGRRLVSRERVREWHGAGKKVITWTVNKAEEMRRMAEFGVDGIVSDDPVLLRGTLGEAEVGR